MSTRDDIVYGMARGPWADMWATEQEERGASFGGGTDLYEIAPDAPQWVVDWASKLATQIEILNDATLETLYDKVCALGYGNDAEHFGYHLGMQSVGHGVSWSDDVKWPRSKELRIALPHAELCE
jgi:hypothetical protein